MEHDWCLSARLTLLRSFTRQQGFEPGFRRMALENLPFGTAEMFDQAAPAAIGRRGADDLEVNLRRTTCGPLLAIARYITRTGGFGPLATPLHVLAARGRRALRPAGSSSLPRHHCRYPQGGSREAYERQGQTVNSVQRRLRVLRHVTQQRQLGEPMLLVAGALAPQAC